ncbi:MAG TPA: sodium/proton-translocating pyrophosphatase, partial [Kiritimatiellia bacterium]|nr:sodium/proton-translocating pyrophosphatase [Kiritimatiellia bacterium]
MSTALLLVIAAGGLAILYGAFTVQQVMSLPTGSDRMREIASAIQEGAQAYLNRQYTTILIAGVVVFAILLFALGIVQALGFAAGAFLSGAAGYIGMLVSVRANVRTTQAASESLGKGLSVAFRSGAVTGLLVAGLALVFALFAAIGVTLGTLFSMPVAAFLGLVLMLVLQLSGFIRAAAQTDRQTFVANVAAFGQASHSHEADSAVPPAPSWAARALANTFYYAYRGTWLALRPLLDYRAPDDLAAAARIPPRDVARALLQQGLFLPGLLALLSAAVLNKREWALP